MNQPILTDKFEGFYDWEDNGNRKYRWIGRSAEMQIALEDLTGKDPVGVATIHVGVNCKNKIRIRDGATVLLEAELTPGWRTLRFELDLSMPRLLKFEVEQVYREGIRTLGAMLGQVQWSPLRNHHLHFKTSEILLNEGGLFTIQLSKGLANSGAHLVIDIYDFDNPVHPDGHLGWWQYPVDSLTDTAEGSISVTGGNVEVTLEGLAPIDSWTNTAMVPFRRLVANAVLRDGITNAILYLDKVPAFQVADDLSKLRSAFNRDWTIPKYKPAGVVLHEDCTIRIVSPNLFLKDAVGNLCLDFYRMLRQNNIPVELYAENCDLAINDIARRMNRLNGDATDDDRLLYFCSTYDPHLEDLLSIPAAQKVAYFHGITKPELLQVFEPELSVTCKKANAQLYLLQEFNQIAANSNASARCLLERFGDDSDWQHKEIHIIPPLILGAQTNMFSEVKRSHDTTRLLYVGRIKSHKKIEHLLELLSAYLDLDSEAELWIVGNGTAKAYWDYLKWVETSQLNISHNKVHWTGSISDSELSAHYMNATVFVTMSEDEGFCLPVFEAMQAGLPVFAYGLPAIREVMQNAGVYFNEKNFGHLARALYDLVQNRDRIDGIATQQKKRAEELKKAMSGHGFLNLLCPVLNSITHP